MDPCQAEREGFSLDFRGDVILVHEWPGYGAGQASFGNMSQDNRDDPKPKVKSEMSA